MTVRQKYQENLSLIAAYKDFYEVRHYQEEQQHPGAKRIDENDEHELMTEIARLLNENKEIRHEAIVQPSSLDNEYYDYSIPITSNFEIIETHVPTH